MSKPKYKVGDRVWMSTKFGLQCFNGYIVTIRRGLFGHVYLLKWVVDSDLSGRYETTGWRYEWRIWK